MNERIENALRLFSEGFNCAQSVAGAFYPPEDDEGKTAIKLASSFGGGMRCGEVCGGITGALMVIGLREGQDAADDPAAKERLSQQTLAFMEEYAKRKGTLLCRELLGYDLRDAEARAKNAHRKGAICGNAIRTAILLLGEMGIK